MIRMNIIDDKINGRCHMDFIESEIVELKSEVVGDICKEVIAFANTRGGTMYIGVANDGQVVGI